MRETEGNRGGSDGNKYFEEEAPTPSKSRWWGRWWWLRGLPNENIFMHLEPV